jgi:hypothetical protein
MLTAACGDISDSEITKGEYSVYYHESENTLNHAKALLAFMDSTRTQFATARISATDPGSDPPHGLNIFVEGEFKNARDNAEQRLLAARLAKRLSEQVFGGMFCSVSLVGSVDEVSGKGNRSGNSDDPRLQGMPL